MYQRVDLTLSSDEESAPTTAKRSQAGKGKGPANDPAQAKTPAAAKSQTDKGKGPAKKRARNGCKFPLIPCAFAKMCPECCTDPEDAQVQNDAKKRMKGAKAELSEEQLAKNAKLVEQVSEQLVMGLAAYDKGFHPKIEKHAAWHALDSLPQATHDLIDGLTCAEFLRILDTLLPVPEDYFVLHQRLHDALKQHAALKQQPNDETESEEEEAQTSSTAAQKAAPVVEQRMEIDKDDDDDDDDDDGEFDEDLQMTEKEKQKRCWSGKKWHPRVTETFQDWEEIYAFLVNDPLWEECKLQLQKIEVGEFLTTVASGVNDWFFDADYEPWINRQRPPQVPSDKSKMQFWAQKFKGVVAEVDVSSEEEEPVSKKRRMPEKASDPVVATQGQASSSSAPVKEQASSSSWWMCRHG